jgi:hypothetical protein
MAFGTRLLAGALVAVLTACGSGASGTSDPCDAAGIAKAIDAAVASSATPAKKGDQLDDLAANITQCEASSPTALTDPHDPLNLQLARADLEAGKAYAAAGDREDARRYLSTAAFTAKFVGDARLEGAAAAALKALH